jgi:myo-inositol-1(or 4)-monophosphatase
MRDATGPDDEGAGESLAGAAAPAGELLALARKAALLAARVHAAALPGAGAGETPTERQSADLRIESKSSVTDLVTRVDKEAERLIVETLLGARPGDGVLGEEGASRQGSSGVRWIIDPLDGTTNFVYGYPAFSVSIAAEVDGRPLVGVVHDTMAGRTYAAIAGYGATCDGRPIAVRRATPLAQALVATGFAYTAEVRARQAKALLAVLPRVRDIRRAGSATLDLCHLAAGRVDAYYELDLSPWDWAAGRIIAGAAGALVEVTSEAVSDTPLLVAASPRLMPEFRELLVEAGIIG